MEGPAPSISATEIARDISCLAALKREVLSKHRKAHAPEPEISEGIDPREHTSSNDDALKNYRILYRDVQELVTQEEKVLGEMGYVMESLGVTLGTMEDEAYIVNLENRRLREEAANSRELIQELRGEMELKEWEIEKEGRMLRRAEEEEVQRVIRENGRLRKELEKERQLVRQLQDVRIGMELKAQEIELELGNLREGQEKIVSIQNENKSLWEDREMDREMIRDMKRVTAIKEGEMEVELATQREAYKQEIQTVKEENKRLLEEIGKERELIREYMRSEVGRKAQKVEIDVVTSCKGGEPVETVETDVLQTFAKD